MVDALTIQPRALKDRLFVKLWRPTAIDLSLLEQAVGVALPGGAMRFVDHGDGRIAALSHGDFVVENLMAQPVLEAALSGLKTPWSVCDTTAGRRCVQITGTGAADLLNCGCSLDLHKRTFAVGRCAETLLVQCHVLIARTGPDTFDVTFDRAVETHLSTWMADARLAFA